MEYSKEQKSVLNIYALLCVSLVVSFIPLAQAAALAVIMFTMALIGAYHVRRKSLPESLAINHMTFVIRTIWIMTLFATVTTSVASVYVLMYYDPLPLMDCANRLLSAGVTTDMAAARDLIMPCMDNFVRTNVHVFALGGLMAATPIVIYAALRLARGLSRALKGHRIGDVKTWF